MSTGGLDRPDGSPCRSASPQTWLTTIKQNFTNCSRARSEPKSKFDLWEFINQTADLSSLLLVTEILRKYEIRVASSNLSFYGRIPSSHGPDHGDCHRVRAWQIHGGSCHAISLRSLPLVADAKLAGLVQGDPSAQSKPPFDIDLKVALQYKVLLLKRNFQINVNRRFGPT